MTKLYIRYKPHSAMYGTYVLYTTVHLRFVFSCHCHCLAIDNTHGSGFIAAIPVNISNKRGFARAMTMLFLHQVNCIINYTASNL